MQASRRPVGSERKINSEHKEGMSMEYQLDDDVQAVELGDPRIMRWTPSPENYWLGSNE